MQESGAITAEQAEQLKKRNIAKMLLLRRKNTSVGRSSLTNKGDQTYKKRHSSIDDGQLQGGGSTELAREPELPLRVKSFIS